MSIRDRPTAPYSPWQNDHTERLIGSIRRKCLDHVVVFGERQMSHVLLSYLHYYNGGGTQSLSEQRCAALPRLFRPSGPFSRITPSVRSDLISTGTERQRLCRAFVRKQLGRLPEGATRHKPCIPSFRLLWLKLEPNRPPVLTPELRDGMLEISCHMMENDWSEMFFKGISAGFLIAAMVWLVPSADTATFHAVTLMTYLMAIGGFTHIVAGSMEAFLLVANGQLGIGKLTS
jgi:hypothetical protein